LGLHNIGNEVERAGISARPIKRLPLILTSNIIFITKFQRYILSPDRIALASRCVKFAVFIAIYLGKPSFLGYDTVPTIYR